jgi:23S rRNA pseudouridine1911/1915/1917 synthase
VTTRHVVRVEPEEAGERLDKLITRRFAGIGRKLARQLFQAGAVHIAGRRAQKGDRAEAGEEIVVDVPEVKAVIAEPEAALDVRLETKDLVVVQKPAGQPSAPLEPDERGSLASALVGHYPEMRSVGHRAREPGLLHRLDTQTSGLLVAARNVRAFECLRHALAQGEIKKRYLAIVPSAELDSEGVVDAALQPDPSDRRKVKIDNQRSRPKRAVTHWKVLERAGRWALIELEVSHAYRHQIRAHLAFIEHPIAGDVLYGGAAVADLGARHALHASYVAWAGDDTVAAFAVEDHLPAELRRLLAE